MVQRQYVPYPARGVQTLFHNAPQYFEGIFEGQGWVEEWLASRSRLCPLEQYVLIGYSSGAMVMHRAAMSVTASLAKRVHVGLIADGHLVPGNAVRRIGSAPDDSIGVAEDWFGRRLNLDVGQLPKALRPRTVTVCSRHDPVCDFSTVGSALDFKYVHEQYRTNGLPERMADILARDIDLPVAGITFKELPDQCRYGARAQVDVVTAHSTDQTMLYVDGDPMFPGGPVTGNSDGGASGEANVAFGMNRLDVVVNGRAAGSVTLRMKCQPVVAHPAGVSTSVAYDPNTCSFLVTVDASSYPGGGFWLYPDINGRLKGLDGQVFDPSHPPRVTSGTSRTFEVRMTSWPTQQLNLWYANGGDATSFDGGLLASVNTARLC